LAIDFSFNILSAIQTSGCRLGGVDMQSNSLVFGPSSIHYLKWGSNKKLLICFHGYGESSAHFKFLAEQLSIEFTTIAIDLPFHGETSWISNSLTGKELASIVLNILKREKIETTEFCLLGFSMGGRIALSLYEFMPERVSKIVLLAPDGLKLNFWYWLSTQTAVGNSMFRFTMRSPGWFLGMLRIGNKVGIINKSIYKFVEYYIHDERVRQELYDRWTSMRHCKPDLENIRKQIQQHHTKIRLLYGKHDRIIMPSPASRFTMELDEVQLQMLDCGHQVLHIKNVEQIVEAVIN